MREPLLLIESAPDVQGIVPPKREVWQLRDSGQIESVETEETETFDTGEVGEKGNPILAVRFVTEERPIMEPNPEWAEWWNKIDTGTVEHGAQSPRDGLPQAKTVLDPGAKSVRDAERAASQAIMDEIDSRTVMVTIDDGIMLPTEQDIELQVVPDAVSLAVVKTRMVAQHGVANPTHVTVETLADFKARQP